MEDFLQKYPLVAKMTAFQQAVLYATYQIHEGEIVSYQDVAERIGNPRAYRAVGNALGLNPYIGDIPCHRVIKSDGSIGGFGDELNLKYQLLAREGWVEVDGKMQKVVTSPPDRL